MFHYEESVREVRLGLGVMEQNMTEYRNLVGKQKDKRRIC